MSREVWRNGARLEWWDDATRTYKTYNSSGTQTSTRAYTAQENASADAAIAANQQITNKSTIQTNLEADLAAMQAIIDDTNANINTNPATRIKSMARAIRRLTRTALGDYTGTE